MSTVAIPAVPQASSARQTHWIISAREDMRWFIGSAAISYVALALLAAGFPPEPLVLFWLVGVDGPHIAATVTRTYFDQRERTRLGRWLWIPLPMLFIGPLAVAAGLASWFFLFAVSWQHFHIVKQHFGFVMLYKAKNGERDRTDFLLDKWLLLASLIVPMSIFILRTRPAIAQFLPQLWWLVYAGVAGCAALGAAWLARQWGKWRSGAGLTWPKVALIAVVVPLQWLALLHASTQGPNGILRAGVALGLFHSFQYHRLLWFHNRNRYQRAGAAQRHGVAATAASHVALYFGTALLLHQVLMFWPPVFFPSEAVVASVWGFSFAHYVLDAKIWHVRSDRELAAALNMT